MGKGKNIDRLFQEKLKDLEGLPDPKIWDNIEKNLNQKKKRRVIPLWFWKGFAASIILGILLFPFLLKDDKNNSFEIPIDVKTTNKNPKINTNIKIIQSPKTEDNSISEPIEVVKNQVHPNKKIKSVINSFKKKYNNSVKTKIASNNTGLNKKNESESESSEILIQNEKNHLTIIKENKTINSKKQDENIVKDDIILDSNKNEKIALTEHKLEKKRKKKKNSWHVQPNIAFLNSGSFKKASTISNNLNNYSSLGESNVSYGVLVGLDLNSKWSVRSGINFQKIGYNTQNISLYNTDDFNSVIEENYDYTPLKNSNNYKIKTVINKLEQDFSYIEFPLEIKYQLLKVSKFSTNIVFGGSSMVLYQNKASFKKNDGSFKKAITSNANSVNFSINTGIDVNYKINNKLSFHINPMFKKPLNMFSDKNLDFNPYQFGIYSGINFKL